MNSITEHYQRQSELLMTSGESITRPDQASDINGFVRSLLNFRALFYFLQTTDSRQLPAAKQLDFLMDLLNKGRHVNDMYVQKRMMAEHEQILGMDLYYLVEYANFLADREEEKLGLMWREGDKTFIKTYINDLTGYFNHLGDELIHRNLLACTQKLVKKNLKKLDKMDHSGQLKSACPVRRKLTDILVFLEILNTRDHHERIKEASIFLDIWHDRMVAREMINHYQDENPEMAKKYTGTLEILKDYLDQKIQVLS